MEGRRGFVDGCPPHLRINVEVHVSETRRSSEPRLPTSSRAAVVAQYVQDLITQRGLAPGTFVASKSELQGATAVARSTVGEALKILQERRVVFVKPGPRGGVFVADPEASFTIKNTFLVSGDTAVKTADAMAVRDLLEPTAFRDAVLWRGDGDVAALRSLVQAAREHVDDSAQTLELIWRLHRRIGEITPNPFLRATYVNLIDYLSEHTSPTLKPPVDAPEGYSAHRVDAHEVLVDAIEVGDPAAAEDALAVHDAFEA